MQRKTAKAVKTNKEYPATHSMSTAWYVADEEGNVGIIDFNENGPVPWETEETCVEELVYGHREDKKLYLPIALTNEQIDDLMENPHSPSEEELWFDCIVQIDTNKEKDFLALSENPDFDICLCISKQRGLYWIDAFDCIVDDDIEQACHIISTSTLKKMLDMGIIQIVYKMNNFDMEDDWDGKEFVHSKRFATAPYYIFHQPYSNSFLPKRMNKPEHPVVIDQFPIELRRRVLKVPLNFKDVESFQIAEWNPCSCMYSEDTQYVDGCRYDLLPMTDGTMAYVNTEIVEPSEFLKCCSEKEKYGCSDCKWCCYTNADHCFTNKPTVLMIVNPLNQFDFWMHIKSDIISWHCIWLPFLPRIPLKIPTKSGVLSSSEYESFVSEQEISKHVNQEQLLSFFRNNRKYLEDMIERFNPRVIILCEDTEAFMNSIYTLGTKYIVINGVKYPMYKQNEIEHHREEIERLALLPYRGKVMPHIISVEEMNKIKKQDD